jgi:ribosomal protein S18 acetylase RimI-like enzyme
MDFRPATKTDLQIVMTWIPDAKSCLVWAGPKVRFPLELRQLYEDIGFENTLTYSLCENQELLALGQIRMFKNNRGHLARIVVNPAVRGKGIGRIFVEKLISEAKRLNCQTISLRVTKGNSGAISLYQKLGFIIPSEQPDNIRKDIYYMELV